VCLIRNPNWDSFQEGLKCVLERGPEMNMKDEAGLGLAILSVQQALTLCRSNLKHYCMGRKAAFFSVGI